MTSIEHKEIKGITGWIIITLLGSTITICFGLAGVYYGLKGENQLMDLRVKILEAQVTLIQNDLREIKNKK